MWAALDARLMAEVSAPVALGLSGGGDSIALLLIATRWAARRGRRILALGVDHRLHPDSHAWTRFAGEAARRAGADWRALAWTGEKPKTGLPAVARRVRHALLAEAARAEGACVLLLAHTLDDVLEGEHMRASDAPTLGRLRAWAPSPVWPEGRGVFLLRPLLTHRREALRAFLRSEGASWLEDPANADPRFARVRARKVLAASPSILAGVAPLREDAATLADQVAETPDGRLRAPRALFRETGAGRLALLSWLTVCASGREKPPRGASLERLQDRLGGATTFTAALAGARIEALADIVLFSRETGEWRRAGAPEPAPICAGKTAVWDGRLEIVGDEACTVTPLAGALNTLSKADRESLRALPAAARSGWPGLHADAGLALPGPIGNGPAIARPLGLTRLLGAAGFIDDESDASRRMALCARSPYVETPGSGCPAGARFPARPGRF